MVTFLIVNNKLLGEFNNVIGFLFYICIIVYIEELLLIISFKLGYFCTIMLLI